MEWQPIETAPKDGTEVIGGYFKDWGFGNPHVDGPWTMKWEGKEWVPSWDNGEIIQSESWAGTKLKELPSDPTHWMPLPPPPSI